MSDTCHNSKGLISYHVSILPIKVESESMGRGVYLQLNIQLQTVPELENKYSSQKVLKMYWTWNIHFDFLYISQAKNNSAVYSHKCR